jgi:hypothetical protein
VTFDELPDVIPDRVLAHFFARIGRYLDGEQIVRAGRFSRRR